MSAVVGYLRFDGDDVPVGDVRRMTALLKHRGHDGRQVWASGPIGLGHCLMRVNNEDWAEAQPLIDGTVALVADLRIDNRAQLGRTLHIEEDALVDMADGAILMAAYGRWGAACVDHIVGDFAFAIWDSASRRLTLGRDPMGQRTLFYHLSDQTLVFASEIKALWAIEGVPRRVSELAIGMRLLHPVDPVAATTDFDRIHVLPGGTVLTAGPDGPATSTRRYWSPEPGPHHIGRNDAYYVATYRKVLEEAVACRVRRLIHPPGLLFSGGFDSGGIAALAAPIVAERGRRMVACTSLLPAGETRPRMRDARAAVEAFGDRPGLAFHEYVRSPGENALADLEQTFSETDGASATDHVRRGLYRIMAGQGVRLAMDGLGGDYTLNVRAPGLLGRILREGRPIAFLRELRARRRKTRRRWSEMLRGDVLPGLLPLPAYSLLHRIRRRGRSAWSARPIDARFAHRLFTAGDIDPERLRQPTPVHNRWNVRWQALLQTAARRMPIETVSAAAHGLDLTLPFHDVRVVEFALAIPNHLRLHNGRERFLARRALGDVLPTRLLDSGPGNDAMEPDSFRMSRECVPGALGIVRNEDREGRISRYIDLDRLGAMARSADESKASDHRALLGAVRAISLARFIAWADQANAVQEP